MTLSPAQREAVLREAARIIAEEIKAEAGDRLDELIVLPLSVAAAHLGRCTKWVARNLPTVRDNSHRHGVRLSDLRDHIAAHLSPPATAGRRVSGFPAGRPNPEP